MWSYNYGATELYHHGVMGMKWGVRRYQNKNGSLTPAGKKHRISNSDSEDIANKKSTSEKKSTAPTRKKVGEMSDEELRAAINRKRLEKDYNTLFPEKVSAGKKFVSTLKDKIIVPAATEAGKQIAKEFLVNQGKTMLKLPAGDDKNKKK